MFDTWTNYRISCEHLSLFILVLNSWSHVQLTAEASLISFICVVAVFIRIAVRLTLFRMYVPFDHIE
jgi:hypothetical protein